MRKGSSVPIGEYMKTMRVVQFILIDVISIFLTYGVVIFTIYFSRVVGFTPSNALMLLPGVIVFKIIVYYFSKLYKLVLDNVGIDEVFRIFVAVTFTNVIIVIFFLSIPQFQFIPEFYFIFTTVIEAVLLSSTRMVKRFIKMFAFRLREQSGRRTLLVGAGAGGRMVYNELRNNQDLTSSPIAFVDDDPLKIGKLMAGLPIYGPISKTPEIIDRLAIEEVIIAIADIDSVRLQQIIQIVAQRPVKMRRLPQFKELKKDAPKRLLEVNVEDLLSRDVIELDTFGIQEFIAGKRVLVTGAGGSIGSELVRQIMKYNPGTVLLLDIYENGIYDLQMELNRMYPYGYLNHVERKVLIASVYNYERMHQIFADFQPQLVFHAAAYKHVPLMEDSSVEAVRTNVLGTYNVCKLSDEFQVEKMVLVSSDKAVRPTNVMGATKRFAEMILQHFDKNSKTNYSAVRFGNVLGSNGSVVPLFRKQIESGGPVTVTDRNVIRYFMTIPEAVSLILQSGAFAKGGEIFILDMGEPVKIIDLAEKMIMLSGFKPYIDIEIVITGLRPGEKLFEELLVDKNLQQNKTANKKIFLEDIQDLPEIEKEIIQIRQVLETLSNIEVKAMVQRVVPTYSFKK
ncbi:MAG: nucleoside-diphosphate sugar epimerase/dehydratase [Candidatus Izemoplasmatales bacterium]|nr:nucleoside-diphosphate sugar epimerase/dehydratase [Candidatus Izemoplasmatales bacterium]